MISRNRVYNAAGGLTAVQSQLRRVKLARYVQGQLIDHMQAIYRHEQFALALYQAFAARAKSPVQRNLF
ncbi:MAG: hypothetical protein NZM00_11765, partial [Anaerolinea sp.]|nr:hypothetical protein [Anaerolinea sp.]